MAKRAHTTAAYTTEFHHEFRAETGKLLVRRFMWFTAVVAGFGLISLAGMGFTLAGSADVPSEDVGPQIQMLRSAWPWVIGVAWLAMYAGAFGYVWRGKLTEDRVLQISFWLVVIDGLLNILMAAVGVPGGNMLWFFLTHFLASCFLPWTAWQALRPAMVVWGVHAGLSLLVLDPVWSGTSPATWASVLASPFFACPGTFWCWVRHSKRMRDFKYRFVNTRYTEMRRELVDARRIHESLFPKPISEGPVKFAFEYEPMRQIGGDFLYAHQCDKAKPGVLDVVLLDVTGHGIPAALTVNRLHGELERIYAEEPEIGPGGVLRLLNRYVNLTLSSHSIYVTGMCIRVDSGGGALEYASGGHPPAFLRAVDGTIEELESTAFVLGACPDEAFDSGPKSLKFGPGDTLMAYTDGAIEARNDTGRMFRIDGIRRMMASADPRTPTDWPRVFKDEVVAFRGGAPEDDTLLLTLHHAVGAGVRVGGVVGVGELE